MTSWRYRAKQVMPQGANTMSKQHVRYGAGTPAVVSHANGPWVWDADNRRYYDYAAGLAAVTLGHNHPVVTAAVMGAAGRGVLHLPQRIEIEASEEFVEAVGAEQVRWVSTGSEATEGALRIARMATGRDIVISVGYHSWFATFSAAKPFHPGCPEIFRSVLVDLPYNDVENIKVAFEANPDRIAAIIVEPTAIEAPRPGYLPMLRTLCTQYGALLIFDEVICGFRFSVTGGSGYFGVAPDLRTYGKTITNGTVPAAAIVGPESLMKHAWPVSGTANAHPLAMAAVRAVIGIYRKQEIIGKLWSEGQGLWTALQAAAAVPNRLLVDGWPIRPRIKFVNDPDQVALSYFIQRLAEAGVLWQPSGANVMALSEGREEANSIVLDRAVETADRWMSNPEMVRLALVDGPISPTGLRS